MSQVVLSLQGKKDLEQELLHRVTVERPEISARIAEARALGDLSENTEYHSARDEARKNESRIEEIEFILKNSIVGSSKTHSIGEIHATLTLLKNDTETLIYQLVSSTEANIAAGKLSIDSPLGKLLLGVTEGDCIKHEIPSGVNNYKVITIE